MNKKTEQEILQSVVMNLYGGGTATQGIDFLLYDFSPLISPIG